MDSANAIWVPAESKNALEAMGLYDRAAAELTTEDPNTWGYARLSNGRKLIIGYANLGLPPAVVETDKRLFVGIDELFVGFNGETLEKVFAYRMPTVFHEFVSLSNVLVVRDEVGFVGVSALGKELWRHLTGGPIERYSIEGGLLQGETIDGEKFSFRIPVL